MKRSTHIVIFIKFYIVGTVKNCNFVLSMQAGTWKWVQWGQKLCVCMYWYGLPMNVLINPSLASLNKIFAYMWCGKNNRLTQGLSLECGDITIIIIIIIIIILVILVYFLLSTSSSVSSPQLVLLISKPWFSTKFLIYCAVLMEIRIFFNVTPCRQWNTLLTFRRSLLPSFYCCKCSKTSWTTRNKNAFSKNMSPS
jgi:hypothetical protein